jgi:hypothetical protein
MPGPKPVKAQINNAVLVENFRGEGGGILHCPPIRSGRKGVTFAFIRKGSRVTFSTAVQHSADTFTKKIGTKTAIGHFHEGHTVTLPVGTSRRTVNFLLDLWYAQ